MVPHFDPTPPYWKINFLQDGSRLTFSSPFSYISPWNPSNITVHQSWSLKATRMYANFHTSVCSNRWREPIKCLVALMDVFDWFPEAVSVSSCTKSCIVSCGFRVALNWAYILPVFSRKLLFLSTSCTRSFWIIPYSTTPTCAGNTPSPCHFPPSGRVASFWGPRCECIATDCVYIVNIYRV